MFAICRREVFGTKVSKKVSNTGVQRTRKKKRNNLWIWILTLLIGILIILGLIVMFIGQILVVRTYSVPADTHRRVRIVGLADLHGEMIGKKQERIVSKVKAAKPDIIVYLGDMVDRTRVEDSVEHLEVLTERLMQIAPIYYVDGNHEQDVRGSYPEVYARLNTALADKGAVHLDNETVQVSIDNKVEIMNICGISTHYYWHELEDSLAEDLRSRDGLSILLCHYPETVIWRGAFTGGGLDLALCGHTHGGLIRVPFVGGIYAPEWGWRPMYDLGEYPIYSDTGWKSYGGGVGAEYWGTMIISGGLAGEHGVPRLNNPMEISVVDIG